MNKGYIKIIYYGLFFFVTFNFISWLSLRLLEKSNFYKPQFVNNEIKNKKYDYVIIGSSNGLTTLNTQIIDSINHTKGFNLCVDDTSINSQYLMLQHFYALGNTSKICVMSILGGLSDTNITLNDNDYRFINFIDKPYVSDYYYENESGWFKPLYFSKFFPLFAVSKYNTEVFFPSIFSLINPQKRNRFDENGNYSYPNNIKTITENEQKKLSAITIKNPYFFKIQELCRQNKTRLVVYQSPLFNQKVKLKNCSHLYINHSELKLPNSYYFDEIHVTNQGTKYCSVKFAYQIKYTFSGM